MVLDTIDKDEETTYVRDEMLMDEQKGARLVDAGAVRN